MSVKIPTPLTIITYHYVRDLPRTRYPQIKGLLTERFQGQLDYVAKHYTVCSLGQVVAAMHGSEELPSHACLLTFDDGFIDHFVTVFPVLKERGMVGSFYPPAKAVEEHAVLDVHKIHFILASLHDPRRVTQDIFEIVGRHREKYEIPEDEELYRAYATQGRFDPPEIVFIKRTLQRGLPEEVRSDAVDALFTRYVSEDEEAFARELYMDLSQLRGMARHGMEIGGHGYKHVWLETLSADKQEEEIRRTIGFLSRIYDSEPEDWAMSYPSGSHNETTKELLRQARCALGITVRVDLVYDLSSPLELNRLDTNDLPCSGDAEVSEWTLKVLG